jgi:hypothetical protein
MNTAETIAAQVAAALEASAIEYLLVGAFSSNVHGIPRSTKDADFVVQFSRAVGAELEEQLGADFEIDPQLSFETNTGTYRQLLRHRRKPFKVELFLLSDDAHDQERFRRRLRLEVLGRKYWFPTAEDVVVTKLRWKRTKDIDDVRNVMSVQRGRLDWPYIEKWGGEHGTLALLNEIRRTVPEI